MATRKITLSEVNLKRLRILGYLLASGVLGWVLATFVAGNPVLVAVFAPAINFVLYSLTEELKEEGYVQALKN